MRVAALLCYSQIAAAYASSHYPWRGFPGTGRLGLLAGTGPFQRISRARVRELPHSRRLSPEDRVDARAAALSRYLRLSFCEHPDARWPAVSGLLDDGLSTFGPPPDGRHPAAYPH